MQETILAQEAILAQRYKIVRPLGGGGFGLTYLAEDTLLAGKPFCVVKQLKPQTTDSARLQIARRLFEQEVQILYRLGSHDQIPKLLAHLEDEQEFYLVQEYIDGESLDHEIIPGQMFSEARVLTLLSETLEVLAFVHQQGVIHRDIKPANLMRRKRDGRIVLIDFGAVKQVSSTAMLGGQGSSMSIAVGSMGYMPSEQFAGRPQFSSDIYAVGMVCLQALTGVPPELLRQSARTGEILWQDRVQVNPHFASLLSKMVRYDFRQRFFSAGEALEGLAIMSPKMAAGVTVSPAGMELPLRNAPYAGGVMDLQARNLAPTEVGAQYRLSPNRSGPVMATPSSKSALSKTAAILMSVVLLACVIALTWFIAAQLSPAQPANNNRRTLDVPPEPAKGSPPVNAGNNPFDAALNQANEASNAAHVAKTKEDWEAVASKWNLAIQSMQAARDSHIREAEAQLKIRDYQDELDHAREKAAIASSSQSPSSTTSPPVIPDPIKPPPRSDRTYLSFNAYSITNGNHIQTFTPDNGLFDAASVGDSGAYSGSVNLSFRGPKDWYHLNFLAPGGERLQRRTYTDAERYPFQTQGKPGLDFSGNGSGCNKLTGRFEINEISYSSANQIDLLEATFERRCEGDTTIIYGRVRYDRRDQK